MEDKPDVALIHRVKRIAVLTDGRSVPITHFFNRKGEECKGADAVVAVAGSEEVGWYTIDLVEFEYVRMH